MRFFMFGAYADGSIAEMSLGERASYSDADNAAKEWLTHYDHGFTQAVVISEARRDIWIDNFQTDQIHDKIMNAHSLSYVLIDGRVVK
jgi:hypothetical protein